MNIPTGFRVGLGYDVHPFADAAAARPLVLGGVTIPHPRGLAGHSDADALAHAIGDALLGALALGDLGAHFPDTDPRYRGISSLRLLGECAAMAAREGFRIANVDSIVVTEEPKIAPHVALMRERLAGALDVDASRISVKATRPEGLGALGRREGIACQAIALVASRGALSKLLAQVRRGAGRG
ncbi:MAG: 2-C-methyl-D-erythritol 2,4-cyclodiphosphate synthase [Acidobacteria bacterium]|nr:2-C-methyl-D-erythritol 2,4-cyclodiphosphate synthase [Acidobacteriota bacterium]